MPMMDVWISDRKNPEVPGDRLVSNRLTIRELAVFINNSFLKGRPVFATYSDTNVLYLSVSYDYEIVRLKASDVVVREEF